jgi:hypothetical protein
MATVQRTVARVETRTRTGPDAQVDDGKMVISPARPETGPFLLLGEAWITVVTRSTGTFTGAMTLPDGTVIPPTGKAFDVEFGQTTKWDGDQLIVISAFYDAAVQRQQIGLA